MDACDIWPFESGYNPSYEWPGVEAEGQAPDTSLEPDLGTTSTSFFRLVAVKSAILPSKHRVAILTGYPEVQFGRDKPLPSSVTLRIRLREMEVSKIHATAFWNGAASEWALVDMGSMHGTFWKSHHHEGAFTESSGHPKVRLSAPRVASLPQPLNHLDSVTIGTTTFAVHIHDDHLACPECASTGNEIPLFPSDTKIIAKLAQPAERQEPRVSARMDPKKSLAMLKQSLLHQHGGSTGASQSYTDRADRRRRMYGSLPQVTGRHEQQQLSRRSQPLDPPSPPRPLVSDPPQRLSASNVGHNLLTKMGWEPGTTLGLPDSDTGGTSHLLDPIKIKHTAKRAGLGSERTDSVETTGDWRETGKRRRYDSTNR